jgi:hypothetical protein
MNTGDLIRRIIKSDDEIYSVPCTVTSVDKTANTCDVTPLNDSADLVDVRLQTQPGKGFIAYPVVGSVVMVSFINKDEGFVSLLSDVDTFDMQTQNESLKALLTDILAAIKVLTVTTPSGPSGTPINAVQFTAIENRLKNFFT